MRVYLGGPMSGVPQFNLPAFDAAEADLLGRGLDVVPPADLHDPDVRPLALASPDGDVSKLPKKMTWGAFLANDVRLIADGGIEAIVVLSGWTGSRGARLETFVGRLCGLPVFAYGPEPLCLVSASDLQRAHGVVSPVDAFETELAA